MASSGTWIATTVVGAITTLWFYKETRSLRDELAAKQEAAKPEQAPAQQEQAPAPRPAMRSMELPALPTGGPDDKTRLDKRASKQEEMSAMFGRNDGESDEDYKKRVMPFLSAILMLPRKHIAEMRRIAEEKAKVTADQDQQLDNAFQPIYNNLLAYANKAVADGTVSPYERNVVNWLEFAGGLAPILEDANSQVAHILSTDQMHAIYDTGFEWGEYLGLEAPWESLNPPPPKH
jgi:hypothetical protein